MCLPIKSPKNWAVNLVTLARLKKFSDLDVFQTTTPRSDDKTNRMACFLKVNPSTNFLLANKKFFLTTFFTITL
jgi:hypothetical protein